MTVQVDIIEGARWRRQAGTLVEVSRIALVWGLAVGEEDAVFAEALAADGVPVAGEEHNHEPPMEECAGLYLEDQNCIAHGPTIVQIECIYRIPGGSSGTPPDENTVKSGGSDLEQVETWRDKNGENIQLGHEGETFSAAVHPQIPRRTRIFERDEQSDAPGAIADAYCGKTNKHAWENGTPGTWLCTAIRHRLVNIGTTQPTYHYTYEFTHNANGWDPIATLIDPISQQPPPGLVEGEGYKTIEWYDEVDFGTLEL